RHVQAALAMITAPSTKKAFNLTEEHPRTREDYGRTQFGQRCLLARRLVESGVRFVTVTDGGWDTHGDNFNALKVHRMPPVDQGLSALLRDLQNRGMLSTTLVLWMTDFGRTPQINSANGRDHWASSGFAIAAGAGVPGGTVVGRTDTEGGVPTHDEYFSEDIGATVYTKVGIPIHSLHTTDDGRPMILNEGRVVRQWM
ncbi:MAG: DUF1501 domain-containing protein, partial [Planctomycetia bacterium]